MIVTLVERAMPQIKSTTSSSSSSSTSTSTSTSISASSISSSSTSGSTTFSSVESTTTSSSSSSISYASPTPPSARDNPFVLRESTAPQGTVYIAVGSVFLAFLLFIAFLRILQWWQDRRMCGIAVNGFSSVPLDEKFPDRGRQPPRPRDIESRGRLTPQYSDTMAYKGTSYTYTHTRSSSSDSSSGHGGHSSSPSVQQLFISPTVEIGKCSQGKLATSATSSPALAPLPMPRKPPSVARSSRPRNAIPSMYLDSLLELSESD
ncbi:hypothetical protein DAKH74_033510 [Maudiozyma humilis]|uniref:Uncharacterized protein n=1 Tax=Maudiozyma humilis TaxID=51915 RepID=A0AAV5RZ86_MAUHU|nr:hypothetical protein DAKH74_033510 [Kazachstania humilis]